MMMMITFMEVKGYHRSNVVNYALWLPYLAENPFEKDDDLHGGQRSNEVKYSKLHSMATNLVRKSLMIIMTFKEVKGQQRSDVVIYVIRLPHLVKFTANTS